MAHGNPQLNRGSPDSERRGYEVRDARAPVLLFFGIGIVAVTAVCHLAAWDVLKWSAHREERENAVAFPASPLYNVIPTRPPEPTLEPEPHHDVLPRGDLEEVRARQRSIIGPDALGWADPDHRFARIPLDRAIDLAVNNGLPTTLPATQPTTQPFMPPASALHGPGGVP